MMRKTISATSAENALKTNDFVTAMIERAYQSPQGMVPELSIRPIGDGQLADSFLVSINWPKPELGFPTSARAVYSSNPESARAIARRLRTGQVFINSAGTCVTQPLGGYKRSGIGREGGVEGVHDFFETKLITGPAA